MAMFLAALSSLGVAAAGTAAIPASHGHVAPGALPPFGTEWIASDTSKVNLSVIDDKVGGRGQVLRWTRPSKPTVVMTYLPNSMQPHPPAFPALLGGPANCSMARTEGRLHAPT